MSEKKDEGQKQENNMDKTPETTEAIQKKIPKLSDPLDASVWGSLKRTLSAILTNYEYNELLKCEKDYGNFRDCVVTIIRKYVNPNLTSLKDLERCLEQAIKIGVLTGYVKQPEQQQQLDIKELMKETQNPLQGEFMNSIKDMFKPMFDALQMTVMAELQKTLRGLMPNINTMPIKQEPKVVKSAKYELDDEVDND